MSKSYSISFKRLENKTIHHINAIKKINSDFCDIYPYFINVDLGPDVRCLLCDGTNVIDVTEWSGHGLSLSDELIPSEDIKDLIHEFVFEVS